QIIRDRQMSVGVPIRIIFIIALAGLLAGCKKTQIGTFSLLQVSVGAESLALDGTITDGIPLDRSITLVFSQPVNQSAAKTAISLHHNGEPTAISLAFLSEGANVVVHPSGPLMSNTTYTLSVSDQLRSTAGGRGSTYDVQFKTIVDDLQVVAIEVDGENRSHDEVLTGVPLELGITLR